MSEERLLKKSLTYVLFAFFLYAVIQYLSSFYPEFQPYSLPILGAFVLAAVVDIRRKRKSKE